MCCTPSGPKCAVRSRRTKLCRALTTNSMSTPHMSRRLTISLQTGHKDTQAQHECWQTHPPLLIRDHRTAVSVQPVLNTYSALARCTLNTLATKKCKAGCWQRLWVMQRAACSLYVGSTPACAQDGASLQLDAINAVLRQWNWLVQLYSAARRAQPGTLCAVTTTLSDGKAPCIATRSSCCCACKWS